MSHGLMSGGGVDGLVVKSRIASLLIRVAWDVGLGSVGSVGAAPVTLTSSSTSPSYSHSSSVSGIAGRALDGGTDSVGVGGGGMRRSSLRCWAGCSRTLWLSCVQWSGSSRMCLPHRPPPCEILGRSIRCRCCRCGTHSPGRGGVRGG